MTEDFSSAPLVVDGVTVQPTWRWSKQYRADVATELRAMGESHLSSHDAERRYVAWYAQEHGLGLEDARARVKGEAS